MAKPSLGGEKESKRDPKTGRFTKGNTTGGRTKMPEEMKQAFRAAAPDALRVLVEILNDEDAKHSDRIRAAEVIFDRGYGKPEQAVRTEDGDLPALGIVIMPPRSDG